MSENPKYPSVVAVIGRAFDRQDEQGLSEIYGIPRKRTAETL